ncbi:MAG: ABC transporter ATP-binding protein [Clostridia bacterium]|nr:ABC transporter ATP-binding protein [Clostridia bacterium]
MAKKKAPKTVVVRGGPGGNSRGAGAPPKNTIKTLKRVIGIMLEKHKFKFMLVILCVITTALVSVFSNAFLKPLIDDYVLPLVGNPNPDFTPLAKVLLTVGLIYLVGIISSYLHNRLTINIAQGTLHDVRRQMFDKMQKLPLKYFDSTTNGNIMSRFTNDTDTLRELISRSIMQIISSAITFVGILFTMITYSWMLTILVIATVFLAFFVVSKLSGLSGKYFLKRQKALGALNGYIEESVEGQKVIKVFNHENIAISDFDKLAADLRDHTAKANGYANIVMPIMGNMGNVLYVLIAFLGSSLALNNIGGLTLGTIASFLLLSKSFTMTVNQVSQQFNAVVMALAGAERIFEIIDEEPEVDNGKTTLVKAEKQQDELVESENGSIWAWKVPQNDGYRLVELKGDVRFNDVVFGYNKDKVILNNINLYAKPGQKIAFIGETGAGKTTITNLINRFYDVNSGNITYDGIDVLDIKKDDLRRSLGIVLQDTNLFSGTIADNIRFGKLDATDEEVVNAAKLANAHFFISHLPDGYDTKISGNGDNLSQGQRQLLAIARAAVANPPVLILDEATSSIDTRTEMLINKGIDKLMENRTVFVIAHRLSTVRDANAIIVLDHGSIIERGDHKTLIADKGQYYRFYTGEFELS